MGLIENIILRIVNLNILFNNLHFTDVFDVVKDYAFGWKPLNDPGIAKFKMGVDEFINYIEKGYIVQDVKDINGFKVVSSEIREKIINIIKH